MLESLLHLIVGPNLKDHVLSGGPIFPIGDVDPCLPVQEPVLGVIAESGATVGPPHRLRKIDPEPRRIYSGREHHA